MIQMQRECATCQRMTLHARDSLSTGWGCLLTLLTAGLFIPLWIIFRMNDKTKPWICQTCGQQAKSSASRVISAIGMLLLIVLLVLFGLAGLGALLRSAS